MEIENSTIEICDNQASFTHSYNQALETISNISFTTVIATLDGQECTPEGICWACYPISRRRLLQLGVQILFTSMATIAVTVEMVPDITPNDIIATFVSDVITVKEILGTSQVNCLDNTYLDYCDQLIIEPTPPPVTNQAGSNGLSTGAIAGIASGVMGYVVILGLIACLYVKSLRRMFCPCV